MQVHGDNKHQAQPINQSLVAAINAATSYKSIVDPFQLARLYNPIQSDLTLAPDCLLSCMLADWFSSYVVPNVAKKSLSGINSTGP
jgi:hypothetical protein